jgi:hypothetical protein
MGDSAAAAEFDLSAGHRNRSGSVSGLNTLKNDSCRLSGVVRAIRSKVRRSFSERCRHRRADPRRRARYWS